MVPNELLDQFAETIATKVAAKLRADRPTKKLLTVKETAVYLGRSVEAVEHLIARREIPAVRVGRRVHVPVDDLDRWIASNKA